MNFCRVLFVLVVAGLSLLSGCAQTFDGVPHKHPACGHWEWVSSGGGLSGHQHSDPGTTGSTRSIHLYHTGDYELFRNGELAEMGRYTIKYRDTVHEREAIYFRSEEGKEWSRVIDSVTPLRLSLSIGAADGSGSTYVRVY